MNGDVAAAGISGGGHIVVNRCQSARGGVLFVCERLFARYLWGAFRIVLRPVVFPRRGAEPFGCRILDVLPLHTFRPRPLALVPRSAHGLVAVGHVERDVLEAIVTGKLPRREVHRQLVQRGCELLVVARLRWPEGFRCPVCGGDRAWQTSTAHWKCAGCGRKTSVTAGTIFHRARTPLSTWFAAIWLVTSQKNGASAQNLHDMLGLGSYETAWVWLHKLRRAMVRPERELLAGAVEVDESFVGGRATGKQGASTDKAPVMIAVENLGTPANRKLRLGRVRLGVADAPGSKQLVDFARTTVAPGSLIRTDGARMFRVLAEEGYTHHYVSGYSSPEPGHVTLPGRVASLLKRWNAGTHHYRVEREHLQYYLDEFTFRFNRRRSKARGMLFYRLLQQSVNTDPHPLADLIGGAEGPEQTLRSTAKPLPSNNFDVF